MCCARARTGVITSTSSAASSVARQTARSPSAAADAVTGWAMQAGDINLRTAFAVAEAVGRVVAGGLAPVHRATMANAKRLG
jgi:hypothetical protein